jgi:outer membrane protein TolC
MNNRDISMYGKKILFLIFLISFFLGIYAQNQQVSIQECQDWAINQSSANVQKELNEQLLKEKINNASSHFYPVLEMKGLLSHQSQVPTLPFDIENYSSASRFQYHFGIEFYQTLFDGGRIIYQRKASRLENESEIHKLNISINQLKEQVIVIYLNILIIDKKLTILSNVSNILKEQLAQLRTLLKEGAIDGNAVDQMEVEILKNEQQISQLLATKQSLSFSLSILTGKDLSQAEFQIPVFEDIELNIDSKRLELAIFDNQISCLEYQRKLYYASTSPQISLVGFGGYGKTTFDIFSNQPNWIYFTGLQIDVPIINWAKTTGVGHIIRFQKSILEAQKSDFEKANRIAIQEKINEIQRIENMLVLDRQINDKYNRLTETARIRLHNGTITVYDFIKQHGDEIRSLIDQEVHAIQLLKAKYELLALQGKL